MSEGKTHTHTHGFGLSVTPKQKMSGEHTQEHQGLRQARLWSVELRRRWRWRLTVGRKVGVGEEDEAWACFFSSPEPEHPPAATPGQVAAAAYWEAVSTGTHGSVSSSQSHAGCCPDSSINR